MARTRKKSVNSFLFAARAHKDKDPITWQVIQDLRGQGLADREILKLLCRHFEGTDPADVMTVQMPAGMIRRYIRDNLKDIISALGIVTSNDLIEALSGLSLNADGMSGPRGDADSSLREILSYHSAEDDPDDYTQW